MYLSCCFCLILLLHLTTCPDIDYMLRSNEKTPAPPEALRLVSSLREKISTKEINEQFAVVHELSRVLSGENAWYYLSLANTVRSTYIGRRTPSTATNNNDWVNWLTTTINKWNLCSFERIGETTRGWTCSSCSNRGFRYILVLLLNLSLTPFVGLLSSMEGITSEATMNGSLHALRNLATHHLLLVVDHLLGTPMPHSTYLLYDWQFI